jgi:hypothetical protein
MGFNITVLLYFVYKVVTLHIALTPFILIINEYFEFPGLNTSDENINDV